MSNRGQISNRSLVLRQLAEELAQLEKLRKKVQTAEKKAKMRTIRACKYPVPAVSQRAAHLSH